MNDYTNQQINTELSKIDSNSLNLDEVIEKFNESYKNNDYLRCSFYTGYFIGKLEQYPQNEISDKRDKFLEILPFLKKFNLTKLLNKKALSNNDFKVQKKEITFKELFENKQAKTKSINFLKPINNVLGAKIAKTIDGEIYVISFIVKENNSKTFKAPRHFDNLKELLFELYTILKTDFFLKM